MAEWKSSECGMVPRLVYVTLTVWPWRTWNTGPGTSLPNVHAWYSTPLAIATVLSVDSMLMSTLSPGVSGGSLASRALLTGSFDASASGDTAAAAAVGVGAATCVVLCKPPIRKNTSKAIPTIAVICAATDDRRGECSGKPWLHSATRRQVGQRRSIR